MIARRIKASIRRLVGFNHVNEFDSNINIQRIGGGNPTVSIGLETYINRANLYCWKDEAKLTIGSYCSIAENIDFILGGDHDLNWVSTYPFIERWALNALNGKATRKIKGNIEIGSDVWIGHGAIILSGSTIGTGSVIGAGAVVHGTIPPYSIAVGVPAKVIRKRFTEEIADALEASKWWLLRREELTRIIPYMDNPEIFLTKMKEFGYT